MQGARLVNTFIIATLSACASCTSYGQQGVSSRGEVVPAFLDKAPLSFPPEALGAGVAGKVWVKGLVGTNGDPIKTEIWKREPEMAYMFDDVARRWFMNCRFSPARDSTGEAVKVWIVVPVTFKLQDFEPPVCTELAEAEYPEDALAMGMEGWVGIAVFVSDLGNGFNSKTVVVARDPPYDKIFDEAAVAAAKASRYKPATKSGVKTEGWCFVKITFAIKGR